MKTRTGIALQICVVSLILVAGCSQEAPPTEASRNMLNEAKTPEEFFDLYVKLAHAFDPDAADLYADNAVIRNTRIYPGGRNRTMNMPAPKYKELIRKSMPLAKERGDTSSYRNVTFTQEDRGVRIMAIRHSNLKNYDSPISILISQTESGQWLIVEEISQSQP